ncbi:MAG: replication initiator protein [Microviridae sp.]|nr:MAG: replication initiator protein [Microviridae sp.]
MPCYFPLPAIRYLDLQGEYRVKVFTCQTEKFTRHSSGTMLYSNNVYWGDQYSSREAVFQHIEESFYNNPGKYTPLPSHRSRDKSSVFTVPCTKCIGCKQDHARNWSIRCEHEQLYHDKSCFLTLTYANEHLPENGTLVKRDLTLFFKRLRKRYGEGIRYIACGEYGDKFGRPHYHIMLYGLDFTDLKRFYKPNSLYPLYTSESLHSIWTYGNAIIANATRETAGYICRYTLKKQFVKYYTDKIPEFLVMSRRPGIGFRYFQDNLNKIFPVDKVCTLVKGVFKKFPVPPYYLKQLKIVNPDLYDLVKARRFAASVEQAAHNDIGFFHLLRMKYEVAVSRLDSLVRVYDAVT